MTIIKWRPARSGSLFENFDALTHDFPPVNLLRHNDSIRSWTPNVDVSETEKSYEISAELPGAGKKEIEGTFRDSVLTIRGERKNDKKEEWKKDGNYRRESRYGSFERSFRFAEGVKDGDISATFENGILNISVPKKDVPETRKIAIK